jgi:hypothetical protein
MMSPETKASPGLSRRTIMAAGAWAAPAIVATAASPAHAVSRQFTLEFSGPVELEPNSTLPSGGLAVKLRENGQRVLDPREVIVELGKGLDWGEPGAGTGGQKTLTTFFGTIVLGGKDNPISATAKEGRFPIVAVLVGDTNVIAYGTITVAPSTYTVTWKEPTWLAGYVGEPLDAETALTATRNGAGSAGIAMNVEPSANLAWASGAQGARSATTAAQGAVSYPGGTFLPTSHEVHTLTASVAKKSEARDELQIFAIPRAAHNWVKDAWVVDGKLTAVVDAEGFDGPYRLIHRINGVYYMESYTGSVYEAVRRRAGDNVEMTRNDNKNSVRVVSGGDRLEVFLAPNTPGKDSSGAVRIYERTVADPPAEAFTWVKQVTLQGSDLRVVMDRAAFDGPYRIQVRRNQVYLMESYNGSGFYSQKEIGATTVQITQSDTPVKSGEVIEIYLARETPGHASAGRWRIATFTV